MPPELRRQTPDEVEGERFFIGLFWGLVFSGGLLLLLYGAYLLLSGD